MRKNKILLYILVVLAITSCTTLPGTHSSEIPNFFTGLFHGFIILFSFIGSMFTDVKIYATTNSGVMYDLGYLMGISSWLSFNNSVEIKIK